MKWFSMGLLLLVSSTQPAAASMQSYAVFYSGTDNAGHSGEATFSVAGDILTITVKNTSTASSGGRVDAIGGFFFDLQHTDTPTSGVPLLTYLSAKVASGSQIISTTDGSYIAGAGTSVKNPPLTGGWGYNSSGGASFTNPSGFNFGFGAVGYGVFDGAPGVSGNNGDYMLVASGYTFGGNGFNPKKDGDPVPVIKTAVTFTLSGATRLNLSFLSGVRFQFGTALDNEPSIEIEGQGSPVVPEPTSLALAGFAGIGLAMRALRRRRSQKSDQAA